MRRTFLTSIDLLAVLITTTSWGSANFSMYSIMYMYSNHKDVIESANYKLFRSLQNQQHCLHSLLPPTKPPNHDLRPKGHNNQIPNYSTELHKRFFIPHSLFHYYWLQLHCHFFIYYVYYLMSILCHLWGFLPNSLVGCRASSNQLEAADLPTSPLS